MKEIKEIGNNTGIGDIKEIGNIKGAEQFNTDALQDLSLEEMETVSGGAKPTGLELFLMRLRQAMSREREAGLTKEEFKVKYHCYGNLALYVDEYWH